MQYRGLFVGLTTIDIQYYVDTFPVSNKKIKTNAPEILAGGPATNAAVVFSTLNDGAFLASPIGENPFQSFCLKDFNQNKLTHFDLRNKQKANPVLASVISSESSGDRNIFTHNPDKINSSITPSELFEKTNPDFFFTDGFYPEFSVDCAKLAKTKNIPVIIDGGSWKPQYNSLLDYTDIIICSNDFYPPGCNSTKELVEFLQLKKVFNIAISRGGSSIIYFNEGEKGEVKINKTSVIDTLGAGDFLHGAFCFYYFKTNDFISALTGASELASLSCKYKGTRKWLKLLKKGVALYEK